MPVNMKEHTGVAAMDVRWDTGVHFIIWQTLWRIYYYVMRNDEKISQTFHVGELKNNSSVYIQRLINDIDNGRYDNKLTPRELHLKYVQEKGLTSYMNNTRWNKIFNIICDMEEETGKEMPVMYKCISNIEEPVYYWSVQGDEYLYKSMKKTKALIYRKDKTVSMSMPNLTFAIHALSLNTLAVTSDGPPSP